MMNSLVRSTALHNLGAILRRSSLYHMRCGISTKIAKPLSTRTSATTTTTTIDVTNENGIASIALNNPKRRNALSTPVLQSLLQQLEAVKSSRDARVLIIKALDDDGAHNNGVFCSGHDLKELTRGKEEDKESYQARMQTIFSLCSKVMTELATFPVPTIAQVDGIATAAGCQLVASCDLAVATSTSRFATPGVHIGLFCSTPAVPLVRTVAKKHALEMLLTGDMISAQRACEIGLINRVVDLPSDIDEQQHQDQQEDNSSQERQRLLSSLLHKEVQILAASIADKSKPCLQSGLQTLRAQQQCLMLEDAYQLAEGTMVNNLLTDDAVEGIAAFLGKRKPNWTR